MPDDEQDFDLTARETAQAGMTRRGLLMTTLATGFALAVQPISAETITTDTAGLDAEEIKIPTAKESIPAYRARPAGRTQLPVILVVHEAFGVHAHIQDICRRMAKQGYLAVAPDLFARQGDVSKLADISEVVKLLATVPMRRSWRTWMPRSAGSTHQESATASDSGSPDFVGADGSSGCIALIAAK